MLPVASKNGDVTPFADTLFTAVSASCVTGLVVVDTGLHWTLFGQIVILCMIQLGGLGFMSFGLVLFGAFSKRVSPRVRNFAAQSFGMDSAQGIWKFVRRIFVGTAVIEGCGAFLLMIRTIPMLGVGRGIFAGIFLSISAFCNAGFDPLGTVTAPFASLTTLATDPLLLLTLSALIILGAAGFLVWNDLWERFKNGRKLSMYSRFVLRITCILLLAGTVLFMLFEWNNAATIGMLHPGQKVLQCFFQAVTPRTAGFDAIGQTVMTDCAKLLTMLLMFVGGASGSTAGGIKIGTFGVLMMSVWATLRGDTEIHVLRRKINQNTVSRALCIMFFVLFAILTFGILIAAVEEISTEAALYECFSAFCTVGLSLSLTPSLGLFSRLLLMIAMYMGRVGILTLSCVLLQGRNDRDAVQYPDAKILIG